MARPCEAATGRPGGGQRVLAGDPSFPHPPRPAAATLVDVVGSAALVTKLEYSGVSLNIAVNYYRPGAGGSAVRIEGEVIKIGKTVCSIEVTVSDKASGRIIAKGTHVKVRRGRARASPRTTAGQLSAAAAAAAAWDRQGGSCTFPGTCAPWRRLGQ